MCAPYFSESSSGMALSSTVADNEKKSNLVGTDVTVSDDGVMSGYAEENIWTVGVIEGEKGKQYTFENGGKYLEGYPVKLTLGDKAFNWDLSAAEGTDMFFVKNFMSAQLGFIFINACKPRAEAQPAFGSLRSTATHSALPTAILSISPGR